MDEKKVIYACKDHVEMALDDYINTEETAPSIDKVEICKNIRCSYCDEQAIYILCE